MKRIKLKPQYFVLLVSIFFVLALVELVIAIAAFSMPSVNRMLNPNNSMIISDKNLGHRPSPEFHDHDELGFRNQQVLKKAEVVVLGDSISYGAMVSSENSWPSQFAKTSGISTYNMAFGGYGPAHHFLLLEEALQLQPKLVILGMYSGNDLFDTYNLVYNRETLKDWRSNDSTVLASVSRLHADAPIGEGTRPLSFSVLKLIKKHSGTYKLLRALRNTLRGSVWSYEEGDWASIKANANSLKNVDLEVFEEGKIKTLLTPKKRLSALDLSDARIREGHRLSMLSIQKTAEKLADHGINFLVLLLPTKEYIASAIAPDHSVSTTYKLLVENESAMWALSKNIFNENAILFSDAIEPLQLQLHSEIQPFRTDQDGHYNVLGNQLIASHLRELIYEQKLLKTEIH